MPRSGRPLKPSERDQNYLFIQLRKNRRISLQNLTSYFNLAFPGSKICHATVRTSLKKKGLNSYVARKKPMLTLKDRIKRLKWCQHDQLINWQAFYSNFEVCNRKGVVFVKRLAHENYMNRFVVKQLQGGRVSVGIWGCIIRYM